MSSLRARHTVQYVLAKRPNTAPQNQHWRDYIAAQGGGGWVYGSKNKLNQAEGERSRFGVSHFDPVSGCSERLPLKEG